MKLADGLRVRAEAEYSLAGFEDTRRGLGTDKQLVLRILDLASPQPLHCASFRSTVDPALRTHMVLIIESVLNPGKCPQDSEDQNSPSLGPIKAILRQNTRLEQGASVTQNVRQKTWPDYVFVAEKQTGYSRCVCAPKIMPQTLRLPLPHVADGCLGLPPPSF